MNYTYAYKAKKVISENNSVILLVLAVVAASIASPRFFTAFNITNLLRQTSFIAIMSIGMTITLLTGGIDLSVGSVLAVGAVIAAKISSTENLFLTIFIPLVFTSLMGFINGVLIAKGKIQPFIATLCMLLAGRGIALSYSHELPIHVDAGFNMFIFLGRGKLSGIPVPFIITLACFIVIAIILSNTSYGRKVYALGGNEQAASLMGINTDRIKLSIYTISGFCSGLAGVLLCARLGAGNPTEGSGYEMSAIAAAVVGGTLMSGGYGRIIDTIFGAFIIGIISNVLNLMGIGSWYQQMVKGIIIIIAVLVQNILKKDN